MNDILQPVAARHRTLLAAALLVLLTAGCQTYQQQSAEFTQSARSGNLAGAVAILETKAEAARGSKDELIWRLEQGQVLRSAALAGLPASGADAPTPRADATAPDVAPAAPDPREVQQQYLRRSLAAFDQAEAVVNRYEEEAKLKVGAELGAALTNQAALPYRGRAYDKVMLNAYKALNQLQLGARDEARVELNRALQRQRDAVAENAARIAEAQEAAQRARSGEANTADGTRAAYDVEKALADPRTGPSLQSALDASLAPMKPYGDYVNPFAVFLDGLFFSTLGENGSDWERGRQAMERVAAIVPENPFLQADLAMAAAAAEGARPENLTYVFFETGSGPIRDEVRIDIPTFLVTSKLAYVGAAFPRLQFNTDYLGALGVTAGEQTLSTAPLASVDSIVANDFKNEWPTIVTKTLITTATKAIVQAAAQKELQDRGGAFGALMGVALTVTNAATTIADTRTWSSLPKEFQYARLITPPDRNLTLTAGDVSQQLTLEPGAINIVYVKSTSRAAPLYITQFALK